MPLALHIPNVVEQAGSLAGFAAVIGLAVLSALYFSQARDLRRLREWAGRAPERAAEMAAAGQPQPARGRVVAAPRPTGAQPASPAQASPPVAAAGAQPGQAPGAQAAQTPGAAAGAKPAPGAAAAGAPPAKPATSNGDAAPAVTATPGQDAADDKTAAAPKPGMPAPASAAAAGAAAASAGAGAASVVGPKVPDATAAPGDGAASSDSKSATAAAGSAPSASPPKASPAPGSVPGAAPRPAPQRPPGSVLPPRTGTLPPVRRLPSSNVGASQTGVLGQAPPQRPKRNPLYIALAVAGVLVLGAAAAIGVPAIVNGSKNNSGSASAKKAPTHAQKAKPLRPGDITVAVLNGTSVVGLAHQIGDRVEAEGFRKGTVNNVTGGQRANSVVMYAKGHQRDAQLVAKRLSINNVEPVDASTQQIAGDATVVIIVGTDKAQ